ncbi:MAG: hypothetical protein WB786_01975 [Thermoplasmata archaeon]
MSEHLILQSSSSVSERCRCGIRIAPGGSVFRVASASLTSQSLFRDHAFCSPHCIRSFCLESLETLDALDTSTSADVVTDLHDLYQGVAETFAAILRSPV